VLIKAGRDDPDPVHAACWGLDLATWPSYTTSWTAGHNSPWEPADREWFPVVDWPDSGAWPLSSRPSAILADPDQFPLLRRYWTPNGADGLSVHVDPTAWAALEGAHSRLGTTTTIHPNLTLD
jgi:hypothetical protein